MLKQIWNRLQLLSSSGSVQLLDRDNGKHNVQVKILDEEVLTNIHHVTPYGFSHSPRTSAQAHIMFPSGDRSFGVALVVGDKRYNMKLEGGEVALHDDDGNYVLMKTGGVVEVKAKNKVVADVPLFECTKDCKIGGKLEVVGDTKLAKVTSNGKDISDKHTHQNNGAGMVN